MCVLLQVMNVETVRTFHGELFDFELRSYDTAIVSRSATVGLQKLRIPVQVCLLLTRRAILELYRAFAGLF